VKIAEQLAERRKSPFNNTTIGFKRDESIVPGQRVTSQSPDRYTVGDKFTINMHTKDADDQANSVSS
jgi:hypothetical protein